MGVVNAGYENVLLEQGIAAADESSCLRICHPKTLQVLTSDRSYSGT
eukprot:COSAG05_NODE_20935_length_275_cov_2.062500_1_plen_46_part_01